MNPDGQIDAQTAVSRLMTKVGALVFELDLAHDEIARLRQQLADLTDAKGAEQ